jgi:hypothetical protein
LNQCAFSINVTVPDAISFPIISETIMASIRKKMNPNPERFNLPKKISEARNAIPSITSKIQTSISLVLIKDFYAGQI